MTNKTVRPRYGNRYPLSERDVAKKMRRQGLSHREIADSLKISTGTAYIWTKGINLTGEQRQSLRKRRYPFIYTKERRNKARIRAFQNLSRFWNLKYSREELLKKIKDFYSKTGRIPLKREFNQYEVYQRTFGCWNKAISAAGFTPNRVIFSKKVYATDGHQCDSIAEQIIDDILTSRGINHERNVKYSGSKKTADFVVGKTIIEYFGLAGEIDSYDKAIDIKRDMAEKMGYRFIALYPCDLFNGDSRIFIEQLGLSLGGV